MRKIAAIAVVMAFLIVPAMAGEPKAKGDMSAATTEEMLKKLQAKMAEKPWLGIEYEADDDGHWVVERVYDNSPAETAGFQAGDVLLSMGGEAYTKANKPALKKVWEDVHPGSVVEYVVQRGDDTVDLEATFSHVPEEIQKKWIAEYMKKHEEKMQMASKE